MMPTIYLQIILDMVERGKEGMKREKMEKRTELIGIVIADISMSINRWVWDGYAFFPSLFLHVNRKNL